jgi:hypothetical protein
MDGVMIDLETWSTNSNAAIASIGAVKFQEGKITSEFYVIVDPMSCKKVGMHFDPETIAWWKKQGKDAIAELKQDGVSIHEALQQFREWFGPQSMKVWGNGAGFDNVIMENAYFAIGEKRPWNWWDDRCYRTLAALFGFKKFDGEQGTKHNALHDAKHQCMQLLEFFEDE